MDWIKSHRRKLMFFILFFIICGSSSIWMSFLFLENVGCKDIAIGLITIAIASVCASAERVLERIGKPKPVKDDDDFYGIAWLVVPLLASILVVGILKRSDILALFISIILYIIYCAIWWYQNRDREIFNNASSALGGEI